MRPPVLMAPALLAALALTVIPSHRSAAAADPVATPAPAPAGAVTKAALPPAVPFIEDDYDRARDEARRRGVPLFIDAWAPW